MIIINIFLSKGGKREWEGGAGGEGEVGGERRERRILS